MPAPKSKTDLDLEEEIASLEAEAERVSALSTTSDANRADLIERLRQVKALAGSRQK